MKKHYRVYQSPKIYLYSTRPLCTHWDGRFLKLTNNKEEVTCLRCIKKMNLNA